MLTVREFTKNDWYAFAGAEPFVDGSDPVCVELTNHLMLIADNIAITLVVDREDEYEERSLYPSANEKVYVDWGQDFAKKSLEAFGIAFEGKDEEFIINMFDWFTTINTYVDRSVKEV